MSAEDLISDKVISEVSGEPEISGLEGHVGDVKTEEKLDFGESSEKHKQGLVEEDTDLDETEKLSERIQKIGVDSAIQNEQEPQRRNQPTTDHEVEIQQSPEQPSIWKELEQIKNRTRGGNFGRGTRAPTAPRSHGHTSQSSGYRRDGDNSYRENRFGRGRGSRSNFQKNNYGNRNDNFRSSDRMEPPSPSNAGTSDKPPGNEYQRERWSSIFDQIKQALENFDYSGRSSKQLFSLFLQAADEYCESDSVRWLKLIDECAMTYAVDQGGLHLELAYSLTQRLIDRPMFQTAAYTSLMRYITHIMSPHEWNDKDHREAKTLCDLFGRLLICSWQKGWDSCAKECNMVLYAVMNAFQTWLKALEQDASGDAPMHEDIAEVSALCIWHVATSTGRKLWLKWPDLVDQMYAVLRKAIVSNSSSLHEETKLKLLDLFMKLNEWPKPSTQQPKQVYKSNASVQTEEFRVSSYQSSMSVSPGSAFECVAPAYVGHQSQLTPRIRTASQPIYSVPLPTATYGPMYQPQQHFGMAPRAQYQQQSTEFRGATQALGTRFLLMRPLRRQ